MEFRGLVVGFADGRTDRRSGKDDAGALGLVGC